MRHRASSRRGSVRELSGAEIARLGLQAPEPPIGANSPNGSTVVLIDYTGKYLGKGEFPRKTYSDHELSAILRAAGSRLNRGERSEFIDLRILVSRGETLNHDQIEQLSDLVRKARPRTGEQKKEFDSYKNLADRLSRIVDDPKNRELQRQTFEFIIQTFGFDRTVEQISFDIEAVLKPIGCEATMQLVIQSVMNSAWDRLISDLRKSFPRERSEWATRLDTGWTFATVVESRLKEIQFFSQNFRERLKELPEGSDNRQKAIFIATILDDFAVSSNILLPNPLYPVDVVPGSFGTGKR